MPEDGPLGVRWRVQVVLRVYVALVVVGGMLVDDDEGCLTPPQPYGSVQYGAEEEVLGDKAALVELVYSGAALLLRAVVEVQAPKYVVTQCPLQVMTVSVTVTVRVLLAARTGVRMAPTRARERVSFILEASECVSE